MKTFKTLFSMLLLAVMAFTFNSCQKDETPTLIGDWISTTLHQDNSRDAIGFTSPTLGSLWNETNGVVNGNKDEFTYSLSGTKLILETISGSRLEADVTVLTSSHLTLKVISPISATLNFNRR